MKLDRLLCTAVVEELQTALGPAGPGLQSEEALSLVTAAEDQVWVWSAGRQELLVCGTGAACRHSSSPPVPHTAWRG